MSSKDRFTLMFTPTRWAIPLSIGWLPYYHNNVRFIEIGIGLGPFGMSIVVGAGKLVTP